MLKNTPKVSLVMASFNRSELLDLSLASIKEHTPTYLFEIIVVNDGMEKDGTREVCKKYQSTFPIRYYFTGQRNKKVLIPRNPSFANNYAIRQAVGEILILTNPEIIHLNNALQEIVKPLLLNPKRYLVIPDSMYFDDTGVFTEQLKNGESTNLKDLTNNRNHVVMPFFLACWKKEIETIGGYDEDFIGYASDDNDLISRLKKNGCFHVRVNAHIVHLYHGPSCQQGMLYGNPAWVYNRRLLIDRENLIMRNVGKDWGRNSELANKAINSIQSTFTDIYTNRKWKSLETASGTGSELSATVEIREQLPSVFNRFGIKRVLDVGCGDVNWMKTLFNDFEFYLGIDVVPNLIESNTKEYGSEQVKFLCSEIQNLQLDSYNFDVVILSDVLVHLSFFDIEVVLHHLRKSNIKYIMITNFRSHGRDNMDIKTGQWRPINWNIQPFNFPGAWVSIHHKSTNNREIGFTDKYLDMWALNFEKKKIPKILHLYWDKSPMAELQTMTVTTFHTKNPDWEIRIYVPVQPYIVPNNTYVPDYTGKDYFPTLKDLDYIRFIDIDILQSNINPTIHNILQSDIFRYSILYEVGGVWCDFDVLWLKSMDYLENIPVDGHIPISRMGASVCRWNKTHHNNISVLFAIPEHPLYARLLKETDKIQRDYANTKAHLPHQVFGTDLLDKLYPNQDRVESEYSDVVDFPYKTFYPYSVYELDKLFRSIDLKPIDNEVMCIHWFNGHAISKAYINSEELNPNCSMTKIVSLIKKGIL